MKKQNVNDQDQSTTQEDQKAKQVNQMNYELNNGKDIDEWKNKYFRAIADYQNLEKRSWQEKEEIQRFASETTLRKFIPAIDSLERAAKHIHDEGLALSLREFYRILEQCGLKRIETVRKQFDPYLMECVEVVEGDDGIVLEEVQSGYMLFDKVLRVAQVKVGKKGGT